MVGLPFDTMAFIPYRPGPLVAADYESWLRAVDNPFFNSRPGIAEYSNWKVADCTRPLGFTHFDFLGVKSPSLLEAVWFDGPLDDFRQEWVRLWGYAGRGGAPAVENQYAYRFDRHGSALVPSSRYLLVIMRTGAEPPNPAAEHWSLENVLRKHWAIGLAPPGESWCLPPRPFNPLGATALHIAVCLTPETWRAGLPPLAASDTAFLAEWLASPVPPPRQSPV